MRHTHCSSSNPSICLIGPCLCSLCFSLAFQGTLGLLSLAGGCVCICPDFLFAEEDPSPKLADMEPLMRRSFTLLTGRSTFSSRIIYPNLPDDPPKFGAGLLLRAGGSTELPPLGPGRAVTGCRVSLHCCDEQETQASDTGMA